MSSLRRLNESGIDTSLAGLWQQGFKTHPAMLTRDTNYLGGGSNSVFSLPGNILIVNTPQLMISFLYVLYNNILTRQLVTDEWIRFQQPDGKKPLRVSSPIGMQRSSYFLTLPLKYSAPLMVATILLHWLVSQSYFIVWSSGFGPGASGERLPLYDKMNRGYSPLAVILAVSLGATLIAVLLINSAIRRYKDVPLSYIKMGTSSIAISAACQRPKEDVDARLFPVSLGAVKDQETESMGVSGRLVVSTDIELKPPEPGLRYLRTIFVRRKGAFY